MNITKVQIKGVEYNLLDKEAQSKIAELKQNTYTKSEVDDLLTDIDNKIEGIDLTPYETIKGASDKYQPKGNYLTEHQSLENYYTKDEVDAALEDVDLSNQLENYATKEYVDGKIDELDLTGFAKKSDVDSAVKAGIDSIVDGATEAMDTLKEVEEALKSSNSIVEALNAAIGNKADKDEVYSKDETDVKFADYYNRKEVDEKIDAAERKIPDLTDYAKKEYVDNEVIELGKTIYTKEEVDEALSDKADKSELEEYAKKDELPTEYDDTALRNRVANLEAIDHSQFLKEHQDISGKVDKVAGKELSTNDYTNEDKAKVAATPNFWVGSQSEFDSLSQDNNTFYFITEE